MANRFHGLVRVPEPADLSDGQLLKRLQALYGRGGFLALLAREQIEAVLKRRGRLTAAGVFRVRVRHFGDGVALGRRGL